MYMYIFIQGALGNSENFTLKLHLNVSEHSVSIMNIVM